MLIYQPAFDIHHCVFRILQLLINLPNEKYYFKKIRILDFYLVFPSQLYYIRFPRSALRFKKLFANQPNSYQRLLYPRKVFIRMESYQLLAFKCLASYNLIEPCLLNEGLIKRTTKEIPKTLLLAIENSTKKNKELIELLTGPFNELDFIGNIGLKARTNLVEYKYDPK